MDRSSLYSLRGVLDNILLNRDGPAAATVSLVPSTHFSSVSIATADGETAHIHSQLLYQYVTYESALLSSSSTSTYEEAALYDGRASEGYTLINLLSISFVSVSFVSRQQNHK
jgi:hypothetical protein